MGFVVIATWVAKDGEAERVLGEAIPHQLLCSMSPRRWLGRNLSMVTVTRRSVVAQRKSEHAQRNREGPPQKRHR